MYRLLVHVLLRFTCTSFMHVNVLVCTFAFTVQFKENAHVQRYSTSTYALMMTYKDETSNKKHQLINVPVYAYKYDCISMINQ